VNKLMSHASAFFQYLDNEKQIVYLVGPIKFRTAIIGIYVTNCLQLCVFNSDSHKVTTKEYYGLNL
jgi:hypothetical protein